MGVIAKPDFTQLGSDLHVVGVPGLRAVVGAEVAQDVPDAVGGADGDRLAAVELGLVPVHLGQGEQLVGEIFGAGFGLDEPERQREGMYMPG